MINLKESILDFDKFVINGEKILDCDFNNQSFCNWKIEKIRSMENWSFNKAFTPSQIYFRNKDPTFRTGPQNGDRFGNKSKLKKFFFYESQCHINN